MAEMNESGMTIVEVIVAGIVGVLFVITLYTLNSVIGVGTTKAKEYAIATAFADHTLQLNIADKSDQRTALTAVCASSPSTVDLSTTPNASGHVIATTSTADPEYPLPAPVSTTWRGFFPAGCGATAPMLWTFTVVWGPNNNAVQQAIYVR